MKKIINFALFLFCALGLFCLTNFTINAASTTIGYTTNSNYTNITTAGAPNAINTEYYEVSTISTIGYEEKINYNSYQLASDLDLRVKIRRSSFNLPSGFSINNSGVKFKNISFLSSLIPTSIQNQTIGQGKVIVMECEMYNDLTYTLGNFVSAYDITNGLDFKVTERSYAVFILYEIKHAKIIFSDYYYMCGVYFVQNDVFFPNVPYYIKSSTNNYPHGQYLTCIALNGTVIELTNTPDDEAKFYFNYDKVAKNYTIILYNNTNCAIRYFDNGQSFFVTSGYNPNDNYIKFQIGSIGSESYYIKLYNQNKYFYLPVPIFKLMMASDIGTNTYNLQQWLIEKAV